MLSVVLIRIFQPNLHFNSVGLVMQRNRVSCCEHGGRTTDIVDNPGTTGSDTEQLAGSIFGIPRSKQHL